MKLLAALTLSLALAVSASATTAFHNMKSIVVVGQKQDVHRLGRFIVAGDEGANALNLSGIDANASTDAFLTAIRERAVAAYPVQRYRDKRYRNDEMARYSVFTFENRRPVTYRITVQQDLGPIHRTMARLDQVTGAAPMPEDGVYRDAFWYWADRISPRKARHLVAVKGAKSVAIRAQR